MSATTLSSLSTTSSHTVPACHNMLRKHIRRKSTSYISNTSTVSRSSSSISYGKLTVLNNTPTLPLVLYLILSVLVVKISAIGNFELEILEMSNTNNHLLSGYCCGVPIEIKNTKTTDCPPCSTAFRLCLKEYSAVEQGTPSISTGCPFGNSTTDILGGSSFVLSDPVSGAMVLPFTFRWTKSFTLILQALDMYNISYPDSERLIEETSFSSVILPSPEWKTLDHIGRNARITYRVRVQCAPTYYNTTCTTFCRPRNDQFGHYNCGPQGEKICLHGWTGDNCEKAVCKLGCDAVHGKCDKPGECDCRPGWQGPLCTECVVYPGCKHGSCYGEAWKCKCDTNWGGILCDQDLNYCGTHEPCKHGGTCENTAPDKFRCTCADGLSGEHCEIIEHPCATQPCRNGGSCTVKELPANATSLPSSSYRVMRGMSSAMGKPVTRRNLPGLNLGSLLSLNGHNDNNNGNQSRGTATSVTTHSTSGAGNDMKRQRNTPVSEFTCACAPGWTGSTCEINIDECAGGPCEHGGTCIDLIGGFRCECLPEWTGDVCQIDVNECEIAYPPLTLAGKHHQNLNASTLRTSTAAMAGSRAASSSTLIAALNAASSSLSSAANGSRKSMVGLCANARECINLPGSFSCVCLEGWGGPTCEQNYDDCVGQCKNGATCRDLVNDYHCACATGYEGRNCETDIDECANSPCINGGECVDMIGKFSCICPLGYSGTLCEEANDHCTPSPCLVGRCLNTPGSYYCHCPPGRAGKHCEQLRPMCNGPQCKDSCFANTTTINASNSLPCSGRGTCEMGISCNCHTGFSGKYCEHALNKCSSNPCYNGGVCIDSDDAFTCECPSGWTGKLCSERATACYPGQCQNGGTCVSGSHNKDLPSQCRCTSSWDGTFCTEPIDQCRGQPCHNGGTCESGTGWFRCVCAKGFTGPDCRININECSPQPCQGGATCIDGIGGYTCICPPGRFGLTCEILVSDPKSACLNTTTVNSPYAPLNKTKGVLSQLLTGHSQEFCNACICENGITRCTNLWCGLQNCFKPNDTSKSTNFSGACKSHEVCVPALTENCLTGPCPLRGDCRALEPSHRVAPPRLPAKANCWPNQANLNDNCARLSILLDRQRLGTGSSVEGLCSLLRVLLASKLVKLPKADGEGMLIIICDLKTGTNDTIEVTVSSTLPNDSQLPLAISLLSSLLSSRQIKELQREEVLTNATSAALVSILEVKVETAIIAEGNSNTILICISASILVVLILMALSLTLFCRQRLNNPSSSEVNLGAAAVDTARYDEEKTNNLQNEENIRRITNRVNRSTTSLGCFNDIELSLNPAAELAAANVSSSSSGIHKSQTLYPDSHLGRRLDASTAVEDSYKKRYSHVLLHKTHNFDVKTNAEDEGSSARKDLGNTLFT